MLQSNAKTDYKYCWNIILFLNLTNWRHLNICFSDSRLLTLKVFIFTVNVNQFHISVRVSTITNHQYRPVDGLFFLCAHYITMCILVVSSLEHLSVFALVLLRLPQIGTGKHYFWTLDHRYCHYLHLNNNLWFWLIYQVVQSLKSKEVICTLLYSGLICVRTQPQN